MVSQYRKMLVVMMIMILIWHNLGKVMQAGKGLLAVILTWGGNRSGCCYELQEFN